MPAVQKGRSNLLIVSTVCQANPIVFKSSVTMYWNCHVCLLIINCHDFFGLKSSSGFLSLDFIVHIFMNFIGSRNNTLIKDSFGYYNINRLIVSLQYLPKEKNGFLRAVSRI